MDIKDSVSTKKDVRAISKRTLIITCYMGKMLDQ